jgi:hypothetical protein
VIVASYGVSRHADDETASPFAAAPAGSNSGFADAFQGFLA